MENLAYIQEFTTGRFPLTRATIRGVDSPIIYSAGLSAANAEKPTTPRDREGYIKEFLNPMIEAGKIGDGIHSKFDDRKFRLSSAKRTKDPHKGEKSLDIRLGITHYAECVRCRDWDDLRRAEMMEKGEQMFQDPHAFFTRGCGIEATPITSDGAIFVGKRRGASEATDGCFAGDLGAVNGWVEYKENLIDVDFRADAYREMQEEFGILPKEVRELLFAGVVSAPQMSDTDFVYLAKTNLPSSFFAEGKYKERRKDREHGELVKIANYKDMQQLLEAGTLPGHQEQFNLLYSLRFSLEQIARDEMAN